MMKIHVKPAKPELIVRDPRSKRPLPAEGGEVPDNSYWRRRLRAGDIVSMDRITRDEERELERRIADAKHGELVEYKNLDDMLHDLAPVAAPENG